MTIDWTKPLQTRDGRHAEDRGLIASYEGTNHVVVINERDGRQSLRRVRDDGTAWFAETDAAFAPDTIVNAPEPPRVLWVNVYRDPDYTFGPYLTRDQADGSRDMEHRIARLRIEWRPGQYDEGKP